MYDGRFRAYHDITFRVTGERAESDTRTVVRSEILTRERYDPLKLDWWISKNGDSYKVMDVSIEGASQMLAHRDEFATYIQRNGGKVSSLMDRLRAMTEG
jgi:phospholipid transport system substrate-binding protein